MTRLLMTAEEFAVLPDDGFVYELVRGEVRRMPTPVPDHGRFVGNLALPLLLYARDTGTARVFLNDSGFALAVEPDTVRGPDIAVVLVSRLPPPPWTRYFTVPPTLAVEVKSASESRASIEEKISDHQHAGVLLIWYVFPETRTVRVDGMDRDSIVLSESDLLDGSDVLPGLSPILVSSISA